MKRCFDITVAILLVMVMMPLMMALAIVLFVSGQPVLYRQKRVGLRGEPFFMYKLNTMREVDGEEWKSIQGAMERFRQDGAVYKDARDPRITPMGRILRRFSIDEIPQLVNVLMGQMSLVGPRPLMPHMIDMQNARHCKRLLALPGITGLWQVRARDKNTSLNDMIDYDLEYIESANFLSDLKICAATIPAVLRGNGAV